MQVTVLIARIHHAGKERERITSGAPVMHYVNVLGSFMTMFAISVITCPSS